MGQGAFARRGRSGEQIQATEGVFAIKSASDPKRTFVACWGRSGPKGRSCYCGVALIMRTNPRVRF